ncbi:MAG TPA: M23 family metallopeptidase, partial [Thermoanaerobaculia bacterium]|nr:M23 family metallopeptidase [Thermoanaerobaculia bacterium]
MKRALVWRACSLSLMMAVLWGASVEAQISSTDLALVLFQDRFGHPYAPQTGPVGDCDAPNSDQPAIGDLTLDYLISYCPRLQKSTGLEAHPGIDFRAKSPEAVYSPVAGSVTSHCDDDFHTLSVYVDDPSVVSANGSGYTLNFLHFSRCEAQFGDEIQAGQRVGLSGNASTDPSFPYHLHVETRRGSHPFPCCKGDPDHPTSRDVIAADTIDPRLVIKSLVFIRDSNNELKSGTIAANGVLRFSGLGFGTTKGKILAAADMSGDKEFMNCLGSRFLEWEVPPSDINRWGSIEIEARVFPHVGSCGGRVVTVTAQNLVLPMMFQIQRVDNAKTNELPFPFSDVQGVKRASFRWYTEAVTWAWSRGIVEGYKKYFGVGAARAALKSNNLYDPLAPVKKSELLKAVFVASGRTLNGSSSCVCGVDAQHWVSRYLCSAVSLGWLGCPFNPDEPASREFLAVLLAAARKMPADQVAEKVFNDVPVNHPSARQITFCKKAGIMEGYNQGSLFMPAMT